MPSGCCFSGTEAAPPPPCPVAPGKSHNRPQIYFFYFDYYMAFLKYFVAMYLWESHGEYKDFLNALLPRFIFGGYHFGILFYEQDMINFSYC